MNEEMNKALIYFGRKDLTNGLYENNIDDNVQIFLTIRQIVELYNLQSKIDKAIEFVESMEYCGQEDYFYDKKSKDPCGNDNTFNDSKNKLLDILKEDK